MVAFSRNVFIIHSDSRPSFREHPEFPIVTVDVLNRRKERVQVVVLGRKRDEKRILQGNQCAHCGANNVPSGVL